MKPLFAFLCIIGLSTLVAQASRPSKPSTLEVSIEVPSPAWSIKIQSLHQKDGKLLVVCASTKSEGIFTAQLVTSSDRILAPKKWTKLPREIYLTGSTWTNGKDCIAVSAKELEKVLRDSTLLHTTQKNISSADLMGRSLKEVKVLEETHTFNYRVVEIDGKPLPVTMDYRPNRFNLTITKGKVTRITKG